MSIDNGGNTTKNFGKQRLPVRALDTSAGATLRNTVVPESARANIEEIKAKVPELAKHLRDDHEAFDSSKPNPLDILTQAKTPITDGGLIQVEPESSSSEETDSSSSAEIAGPESSGTEDTEGTTAVESLTPRKATGPSGFSRPQGANSLATTHLQKIPGQPG